MKTSRIAIIVLGIASFICSCTLPLAQMGYEKSSMLVAGQTISAWEKMISADGRFALTVDPAGNLVLFRLPFVQGTYLWSSNTPGSGGQTVWMQSDGNLVLRNSSMTAVWASHTDGNPGAYLALQDDGNLVIYTADNRPIWATNTAGH